ncbi:YigZ family protein [Celerinatantimonas yamalensis]|uniref:YigZ family protein n=1 Tax=Celerinatantimonas yamalensis TaxID=559956 RepID=A0ABW9G8Y6_9GAMM
MSHLFSVPQAAVECQQTIKKSRFITYLLPVSNRADAMAQIEQLRQRYPDARHHCWAFIAGSPEDTQVLGFSDDGEPSGTAGRPILAQLQGSGLGYVCAVVVRYFGGIKLGTGGLARAYGSSVAQALTQVVSTPYIAQTQITVRFDFDSLGIVNQLINQYQAEQIDVTYSDQVTLQLQVARSEQASFSEHLTNACSGQIEFIQ